VPVMATPLHLSDSPQRPRSGPGARRRQRSDPARTRLQRLRDRRVQARQGDLG
jgi:hypothetical protein